MPTLFSKQSMAIGKAAADELVEKAVNSAGPKPRKKVIGEREVASTSNKEIPNRAKNNMLPMAPQVNKRAEEIFSHPVIAKTLATRAKTPKGRNCIMSLAIFWEITKIPFQN